jgi:hypothetical protein
VTLCKDNVFPFYDSGIRDGGTGQLIPEEWYYGQLDPADEDYPGCDPNDSIWDDGFGSPVAGACENEWEETSGANLIQYRRRVQLQIPTTFGGSANHFLAVDTGDNLVGNTVVAEGGGAEDYNLDGTPDGDYDGDDANDWMLYVESVEERDTRVCVPAATLPTWTPTFTVTPTPTETFTPTPTQTPVCRVSVYDMRKGTNSGYTGSMGATITNGHATTATIERLYFDWGTNMRKWAYHDWMRICTDGGGTSYCGSTSEEIWDESSGSYSVVPYTGRYMRPVEIVGPPYTGMYNNPASAQIGGGVTTHWWAYLRDSAPYIIWDGYYQVCFDFMIPGEAPGGGDDVCTETYEGSLASPTPTPTITLTPTGTPWPTPTPGAATATRTPTSASGATNTPTGPTNTPVPLATSTPTPYNTPTPRPPTPTSTATKTSTPSA